MSVIASMLYVCRVIKKLQDDAALTVICCRLWKGITPLWGRQIPYTMMKFGMVQCLMFCLYAPCMPATACSVMHAHSTV